MANILGLALKVTGDASGLAKSLTPVDRALDNLAKQADRATAVFKPLTDASAGAARAQEQFAERFARLADQLQARAVGPEEYAAAFATLTEEAKQAAAEFERGIELTRRYTTAEEDRATQLQEIAALVEKGAISEQTAARARADISGENARAAEAEKGRLAELNRLQSEASAITEKYRTDAERRVVVIEKLDAALAAGRISEETYKRAIEDVTGVTEAAAKAAGDRDAAFAEGQRLTEQLRTSEERRAAELANIDKLLAQGAISEETATRAREKAAGAVEAAAKAEAESQKAREKILQDGARLTEQFATEEEKRAKTIQQIDDLLKAGAISEETYARAKAQATGEAEKAAEAEKQYQQALAEGQRLTEQYRTTEEKRAAEVERINKLLAAGVISEETAARAKAEASGANAIAAKAEKDRADAIAAAARIIQANLTPQERYGDQMQELREHLDAGRLSQEQFNRAAAKARQELDKIERSANGADKNIQSLVANVRILSAIEIGRLLVDGFQALSSVFQRVGGQVTSLASSVNTSLDTLNDFSARTGIGVEALQGYSVAAKMAGVDTEAFGTAVQKLAVNIGKATPGDALDKSLKGINLSVAQLRTLAPEEQFSAIGNAISQLPTTAERAAVAVEIFGKQGAALAPLFREGAASIEELRARAERLGVIVSETQVNNVADMNDAFDLVRATIEGITGQVIGNLGPAITNVTDQFLKFVETWSGAQGEGGTGIANAITDVLLQGAEYFAGIFDTFVAQVGPVGETFSYAAEVFDLTSKILLTASEGLRAAFNALQGGIDMILIGLGKIVESLGSYISSDLEQFGAGLVAASEESARKNAAEMEQAAANAANTFNSIFTGGSGDAKAAGQGAAQQYLQGLREDIENARKPEVKVGLDLGATEDKLQKFLATATDGGSEFLRQSTETLDTFQKMTEAGGLTADQIKIMNGFMANLNTELDKELATRREAIEATAKQAEEDQKRIKELLKPSEEAGKVQSDLDAVYREQERVQEQLAAARSAASSAQTEAARELAQKEADAAAASLASLDQIEAKLKETQQAAKQGFSDGFAKQFKETEKAIESARVKANDLGKAGLSAATELAAGVAALQERARAGFLNKAEYDQQLARLQGFFEEALKREQENQRLVDETKQAANVRVDQFLKAQLDERTKREIAQQEEIAKRKQKALENVAALQDRIATQEKAVAAAREGKDLGAARARQGELTLLKKTLVEEKKIANGRAQNERQQLRQFQQGNTAAQQFQSLISRQNDAFLSGIQNAYAGANAALAQSARVAEEQARRMEALTRPTNASVNVADIRTAEGQSLVQDVAAQAQDPALIEARLQTRLLNAIASGITGASANYFNQPVAIVGAARLG